MDKEKNYSMDAPNGDGTGGGGSGLDKAPQPKTLKGTIVRILHYFAVRPNLAVAAAFFTLIFIIIVVVRLF